MVSPDDISGVDVNEDDGTFTLIRNNGNTSTYGIDEENALFVRALADWDIDVNSIGGTFITGVDDEYVLDVGGELITVEEIKAARDAGYDIEVGGVTDQETAKQIEEAKAGGYDIENTSTTARGADLPEELDKFRKKLNPLFDFDWI